MTGSTWSRRGRSIRATALRFAKKMALMMLSVLLMGAANTEKFWNSKGVKVAPPPPLKDFEKIRELAFRYAGRTYTMGGTGFPNFDCSGFVGRVYAEAGYILPRVSRDQARVGKPVKLDALKPGDLVFFARPNEPISHVGMYLGDGALIHAASSQGAVVVQRLSSVSVPLVAARRIIGSDRILEFDADAMESIEHGGQFALPPMLRRPARLPEPSYGPELPGVRYTGLGARAAMLTVSGDAGFTVVPEAEVQYSDWGLDLVLAAPILFPIDGQPTVGEFNSVRDYLRFLRTARLGLPGADLELAVSRLGDLTFGPSAIVDHVAPGTTASGIPGLTTSPSPLATRVGFRWSPVFIQGGLDDALDPRFGGLGSSVTFDWLTVGLTGATDQAGRLLGQQIDLNAVEGYVRADIVDSRRWSFDVAARSWGINADAQWGAAVEGELRAQYRFGDTQAVSFDVHGGYLGPQSLRGLFGATYLAHRDAHAQALDAAGHRPAVGGDLHVQAGKWHVTVGYNDAIGTGAEPFDRSVVALMEIRDLSFGSRLLDARAVYVARAFARRGVADVAQLSLQVKLTTWFALESYYQLGTDGDGGAGAAIRWAL